LDDERRLLPRYLLLRRPRGKGRLPELDTKATADMVFDQGATVQVGWEVVEIAA
jgi:hypothetical protein